MFENSNFQMKIVELYILELNAIPWRCCLLNLLLNVDPSCYHNRKNDHSMQRAIVVME